MASLTQLSDEAHCCLRIRLGLSIREPQLSFVWIEVFIAWKLDSERKYPRAVKVAAKNVFRPDLRRYATYICHNLSVQTQKFNRRSETDFTFQQTKWQRKCRNFNPPQQLIPKLEHMSCKWRILEEKRNPLSKVIYIWHQQLWAFVATTMDRTLSCRPQSAGRPFSASETRCPNLQNGAWSNEGHIPSLSFEYVQRVGTN